jgi:CRISPR-associated protein Csx14
LLELADRLWGGAEGWFEADALVFNVRPCETTAGNSLANLLEQLASCHLTNTMTSTQLCRRVELASIPKKEIDKESALKQEAQSLDVMWRESPLVLHEPFNLLLDWYLDDLSKGDELKTWAGRQSVFEIASNMKAAIDPENLRVVSSEKWLQQSFHGIGVPFYFDSVVGSTGSDRDVGFSFDPLGISLAIRPLTEFTAFVGLQRFRPSVDAERHRYFYATWSEPLTPRIASVAACGLLAGMNLRRFEFRLHHRSKYLKSFLPAKPIGR